MDVPYWAVSCLANSQTTTVVGDDTDRSRVFRLASVSKLVSSYAILIAVDEGVVTLDDPIQHVGNTVTMRQLLSHASGLSSDDALVYVAEPMTKRVYSNAGIELAAQVVEAASGFGFAEYLRQAVLQPLAMHSTQVDGSPAHGYQSTIDDMTRFASELLRPTLLSNDLSAEMATPQWPQLNGMLPGYGAQHPNPWGLGVEIRGTKSPHWCAPDAPPSVFGHFGQSGCFVWIDQTSESAVVFLGDRAFGPWAVAAWAPFNQSIRRSLSEVGP
jgi:CubicO group peptidase (beta-lactamase class C family)